MRRTALSGIFWGFLLIFLCIHIVAAGDVNISGNVTDGILILPDETPVIDQQIPSPAVSPTLEIAKTPVPDDAVNESVVRNTSSGQELENLTVSDTVAVAPPVTKEDEIFVAPQDERQPASKGDEILPWTVDGGKDQSSVARKLSTDLLGLVDPGYLPQGSDQQQLRESMISLNQLEPASPVATRSLARTPVTKTTGDQVYVYIKTDPDYPTSIADAFVSEVVDRDEDSHVLAARMDVNNLEVLAGTDGIRTIETVLPPVQRAGSVMTDGDAALHADAVKRIYGINGTGVKIGVISMGIEGLAGAQATGDLPNAIHVFTAPGDRGNEGITILEIIHDIAPGAELYYHYSGSNKIAFEKAVDNLTADGCSIIYDDVGWIDEPFFEDGPVASHINGVIVNQSILYVSAAGNYADSHYQGMYMEDVGAPHWMNFSVNNSPLPGIYLNIPPQDSVRIILEWDDPFQHSGNDYDLYLINATNETENIAWSIKPQTGTQDPLEIISYTNTRSTTLHAEIAVNNFKNLAVPKTLEVYVYPDDPEATIVKTNIVPGDSVYGHPALSNVISAGAMDWYPQGNTAIEYFSSRGPVTIRYPAAESRPKPDITGVDGVNVTGGSGHFMPFWGTSASGAHIAGILGLEKSGFPGKKNADLKSALFQSAKDLGPSGYDTTYGWGLADAQQMYSVLNAFAANFTANKTTGAVPFTVRFNDTSRGSPTTWNWSFGDGSLSASQNPVHTYASAGIYPVSLTISNATMSDTKTIPGYIQVSAVRAFPGYQNLPRDLNGDGLFEDLNGNGRRDFDDVIVLFNNMEWIPGNEPLSCFDFNRNGRIDFDDIIRVFDMI